MWHFRRRYADLNFSSETLREDIKNVGRFWLDQGVDGFRLDAARHVYGDYYSNIYSDYISGENQAFWEDFRSAMVDEYPNAFLVGEVWERNTDNMISLYFRGRAGQHL